MNEETLLIGRMLVELTHRSDNGFVAVHRQDTGWRVRVRVEGREIGSASSTLLTTLMRIVRRVLEAEANADLVSAGTERALTLGEVLIEAGLVTETSTTNTEGGRPR